MFYRFATWHLLASMPIACLLASNSYATEIGTTIAQIQSLDRFETEQERLRKQMAAQPVAYQDKFMESGNVAIPSSEEAAADPGSSGLRTYGLEARYGFSSNDSTGGWHSRANEWGLRGHYTLQTFNHGEWNILADTRQRQGDSEFSGGPLGYGLKRSSERLTLRNYGLPLGHQVFADTTLGDQYSETTDALRRNYRLFMGNSAVRGTGTRIYGPDFDISAGLGERGSLVGGPFAGFEPSSGTLAWLGSSRRWANGYFAGVQINQAHGVAQTSNDYALGSAYGQMLASREDVSSLAAAVGYGLDPVRDGDYRLRLVWLQSQTSASISGRNNRATGAFIDGGWRMAGLRHEFGLYQADPNLRFGDNLVASDNRGAYWRVDGNSARLSWGLGIDAVQYNPDRDPARYNARQWGVYGNMHYRIDRHNLVGASGHWSSIRRLNTADNTPDGQRSLQASGFYQTRFQDWAPSRLRVNLWRNQALVLNDTQATGEEIEWEQDWVNGRYETLRPEFTTTLGVARDRSGSNTQTYPTAGVMARHWISPTWNIGGTLRYTSRSGNLATSRGLSGSVNTEAQLSAGWRIGASIQLNQARIETQNIAGIPTALVSRSNDKSAYIYLRWDGSSGEVLRVAGQGDARAAGGGSIQGTVFFDANNDGEQQANENGVPNVEVFLDGRYRSVTNAAGQFEFPMVAAGGHHLSLRPESVPLPWGTTQDRSNSVEVPLRGTSYPRIPVIRVGGE